MEALFRLIEYKTTKKHFAAFSSLLSITETIFSLPSNKFYCRVPTLNTILEEVKDVPVNRLEELYQLVHSLTPKTKQTETCRKKILSFGGAFSDMSSKDYTDFQKETKKIRAKLFDRNIDL